MQNTYYWRFTIIWLILNAICLYIQCKQSEELFNQLIVSQSKTLLSQIDTIQYWNSIHGGVYMPATAKSQANSEINQFSQDKFGSDSKELTLLTHGQMIRQLSDLMLEKTGIQFHFTSLNPKDPQNQADEWEMNALQMFYKGQLNSYGKSLINETAYFRYMEPVKAEQYCLSCHDQDGKDENDIVGGISVSFSNSSLISIKEKRIQNLYLIQGFISMCGLLMLSLFELTGQKTVQRLEKVKGKLRLAYIDSLTKLPNRRRYDIFLRKEWSRAKRKNYSLSMIMIDIDYFKNYNDSLGHPEGDQCLKKIAMCLKKYFKRPGDLIARYGGEEFCIIALCNAEQIMMLAESLRKEVENSQIPHPNSKVSNVVTISLGVSSLIPDEDNEPEQLLHYADRALYLAKESGRNQVKQYEMSGQSSLN